MKTKLTLPIITLLLVACAQSTIPEGKWIDKETEKVIATIENKDGKSYLNIYSRSFEIQEDGADYDVLIRDQQIPLVLDADSGLLIFNEIDYIPYSKSVKNQFVGQWKSEMNNTLLKIRIDDNMNLTWEVIEDSKRAVEFWPKRTEDGFYYTFGHENRSYVVKGDIMVDNEGTKYSRITDL